MLVGCSVGVYWRFWNGGNTPTHKHPEPPSYPPKALLNSFPRGIHPLDDLWVAALVGMMLAGRVFVGFAGPRRTEPRA